MLHGPEVIDSGEAALLVAALRPVRVVVAGVMARCAAEEHGLLPLWTGEKPSIALAADPGAVLGNRGRSAVSGRVFGEVVASRLRRPFVQLECSDRTAIGWNGGDCSPFAKLLGWRSESRTATVPAPEGNRRRIRGCRRGDAVLVNGIVVGRATADEIVLGSDGDRLEVVQGCTLKAHGVEKLRRLGPVWLPGAWCTAGPLRSGGPRTAASRRATAGRVLVLDHDAAGLYRDLADDHCGILAIGDDTTATALHLGAHLGLPVLGIGDGDGDGIVETCNGAPGSLVLHVISGRDDDIGRELADGCDDSRIEWEAFVAHALQALDGRVRVVR